MLCQFLVSFFPTLLFSMPVFAFSVRVPRDVSISQTQAASVFRRVGVNT